MPQLAGIPRYALYGEPERDAERDFLHVETIAARSSLHDWEIKPHRHRDLLQLLLMVSGGGELRYDGHLRQLRAPTLVVLPATVVHGFRFDTDTAGYVLTVSERFIGEALIGRMAAEVRPALARAAAFALSVCPEMIFRQRKLFGNKGANFDCLTGRKTSLFSNSFGDLDYNNSWL